MEKAKPLIIKVNGKIIPDAYKGNGRYIVSSYPKTSRKKNKVELLNGASEILKKRIKTQREK